MTSSGSDCLFWSDIGYPTNISDIPDLSEAEIDNFCRNPDNKPLGPWCYTSMSRDWQYCDVPYCQGKWQLVVVRYTILSKVNYVDDFNSCYL